MKDKIFTVKNQAKRGKRQLAFAPFLFLQICLTLTCCQQKKVPISYSTAQIEFEVDTFDVGKISMGSQVKHSYKFSNVGNTPLVINHAGGTCACTTAHYPKYPISPGESDEIEVIYDAGNETPCHFMKSVVVTSNSEKGSKVLFIKGEIVK